MQKAAAKLQKKQQLHKKKHKIIGAAANFLLFTLHFSLYFVPLQAIRVSNCYLEEYDQSRTNQD